MNKIWDCMVALCTASCGWDNELMMRELYCVSPHVAVLMLLFAVIVWHHLALFFADNC